MTDEIDPGPWRGPAVDGDTLYEYRVLDKFGDENRFGFHHISDARDDLADQDSEFPDYAPHRIQRRRGAGWVFIG